MGHSLTKPIINTIGSKQQYNAGLGGPNPMQAPASSHGGGLSYTENN